MNDAWDESVPIYVQIRDRIVRAILDGAIPEGAALPSVRQVAADCQVNPMTAMKALHALLDDGLAEKRRGLGMFVLEGARERLITRERERFLEVQWPETLATIRRLGLDPVELLAKEGTRS
ncbi:GntR family transcriptional regulator [Neokomagataea thailandica NBRC 106555]|uniref:GntR family transcriptional regulator n=2 Tax=Neokomagataea TaxID=1223423 RepID=A0A4Y6V695_9PROT|nr:MULTISPECIES: GntR family transcriptional regulator [Neokomagataea]QDH25483.1 GntR family transcriptional regulator [Neokomagataea tanensis]GBR54840.1 GntR family transcriptional regulator [Neokomagataea thailandica NBRC 106555]